MLFTLQVQGASLPTGLGDDDQCIIDSIAEIGQPAAEVAVGIGIPLWQISGTV